MNIFNIHSSFVLGVLFLPPRTYLRKGAALKGAVLTTLTLLVILGVAGGDGFLNSTPYDKGDQTSTAVHNVSLVFRAVTTKDYFPFPAKIEYNMAAYSGTIGRIHYKSPTSYARSAKKKRKSAVENSENVNRHDHKYNTFPKESAEDVHPTFSNINEIGNDGEFTAMNNIRTLLNQSGGLQESASDLFLTNTGINKLSNNFTSLKSTDKAFSLTNTTTETDDLHRLDSTIFREPDHSVNFSEREDNYTAVNNTVVYGEITTEMSEVSPRNISETVSDRDFPFTVASETDDRGKQVKVDKPIYIQGLFEITGNDCREHPEAGLYEMKAAQLAIKHINERQVITGYKLEMYENDTKELVSEIEIEMGNPRAHPIS